VLAVSPEEKHPMSITFYYAPMSSATRVHWALEEVGVPYDKVKVSLADGDHKKPDYLALNPNGKIPLLVVDGVPIFESLAMLLYLADQYGVEKGLFPTRPVERAEAFKWMAWGSVSLVESLSKLLHNTSERFPAEERNEKAAEAARKELARLLGILDNALEGKEFLVPSGFSLADVSVVAFMPLLGRLGIGLGPFKNVNAWFGRCMARPALARAMMG
jgi:glutathione S-transferase